ncbi:pilin [Haloarchaeobius litoreus]|uniref:Pilin n=1 Tax=Haloarchaeobius litoreus TaxID=755306 RepID=A0ABD6DNX5_9EURY|nr:pilin [Haloarchaeobius litoreus]
MIHESTTEIRQRIADFNEKAKTQTREHTRHTVRQLSANTVSGLIGVSFILLATGTAAAQEDVGNVYCDTGVETGIDLVFGAVAGLGLPATAYYLSKGGLSYMRAGGNPEKKNQAKNRLVMSAIGFGIVVLALLSPELVDKIGSQMGFGFSDCVKPF